MSRKTASATPVTPNPSLHTSWFLTVTRWSTRCSLNSSATFSARCWWNSTVCRWPVGAMVRRMAWEREPLPVPTTQTPQTGWEQQRLTYYVLKIYLKWWKVRCFFKLNTHWKSQFLLANVAKYRCFGLGASKRISQIFKSVFKTLPGQTRTDQDRKSSSDTWMFSGSFLDVTSHHVACQLIKKASPK